MKFKVTDKKGNKYLATSKKPVKRVVDEDYLDVEDGCAKDAKGDFTPEEVKVLKNLLAKADDILALLKPAKEEKGKKEETKKPAKGKKEDDPEDDDILENFDRKDQDDIDLDIDTDEEESFTAEEGLEEDDSLDDYNCHDSKKSFGSIERKQVTDSVEENDEIAQCWAKYYGGKK